MNDLFGKMLDMIMKKGTGTGKSSGSLSPSSSSGLDDILTSVLGKNGSSMNTIVKKMLASGLGSIVRSWINKGPNHLISPDQIQLALGDEELTRLASENGISKDELSKLLAEHLPDAIDQMTPDGELRNETGGIIDLTPLDQRK